MKTTKKTRRTPGKTAPRKGQAGPVQIARLTKRQEEQLHQMYQNEWWTRSRELADVRRMLRHCDIVVAFCDPAEKRLVAFARVITDYVYKALILDVIVAPSHRGKGVST